MPKWEHIWVKMEATGLFSRSNRVVAAVSGGSDSMVLAWLLHQRGQLAGIAHCNFGLRPEAASEEALVKKMASEWDVPCWTRQFPTQAYASEHKLSIQVAARHLRYHWFRTLHKSEIFDYIALAHHADDQAETILMNLFRSKSNRVLMGIPQFNPPFIRPLLKVAKSELLQVAESEQIPFMEDASNASTKYLRNLIRHELVPVLEKVNPSWRSQIIERKESYTTQLDFLASFGKKEECREEGEKGRQVSWWLNRISKEEMEIYFPLWLEEDKFRPGQVTEIMKLIGAKVGRKIELNGREILKDRNRLLIRNLRTRSQEVLLEINPELEVDNPQEILGQQLRLLWVQAGEDRHIEEDELVLRIDPERVSWPIRVRTWIAGDRMHPLGMRGSRKLKDIFTDQKRSRFDKMDALVFEDEKQIIALSGYRISESVKVGPEAEKELWICLKKV